jgi:positive regulator of sigma E activity
MIKRIGTVLSAARNRARVAFTPEASEPESSVAPAPCCRPATDAAGEELEAASRIPLHSGDRVEVLVPEPRSLGARLTPLLPAILLPIAGAIAGGALWGDVGTGIGISVGLAGGVAVAWLVGRRMRGGKRNMPEVLRLIHAAATDGHCPACAAAAKGR